MSMLSKYFPTSTKIRQLFPFLKVDRPTELGRWKPLDNSSQLNRRIDMANEDHCGPCGTHDTNNIQDTEKKSTENIHENKCDIGKGMYPHYPMENKLIK